MKRRGFFGAIAAACTRTTFTRRLRRKSWGAAATDHGGRDAIPARRAQANVGRAEVVRALGRRSPLDEGGFARFALTDTVDVVRPDR